MNFTDTERTIINLSIIGLIARGVKISTYNNNYLQLQEPIPIITPIVRWSYGDKKGRTVSRIKEIIEQANAMLNAGTLSADITQQLENGLRDSLTGLQNLQYTYYQYPKTAGQIQLLQNQVISILQARGVATPALGPNVTATTPTIQVPPTATPTAHLSPPTATTFVAPPPSTTTSTSVPVPAPSTAAALASGTLTVAPGHPRPRTTATTTSSSSSRASNPIAGPRPSAAVPLPLALPLQTAVPPVKRPLPQNATSASADSQSGSGSGTDDDDNDDPDRLSLSQSEETETLNEGRMRM